jgi:hypothetical protein
MKRYHSKAGLALVLLLLAVPARADEIPDAAGDFLDEYTGPHDDGLDVLGHEVTFMGDRLVFFGRMAGPIAPTQAIGGLYVIGVDRGRGTPRFLAGTPVIGPNVLWDLIVRINPNGTGVVNNQVAGVVTPLNPADISINGNEFIANVPLSLLMPGATRLPLEWTYNLWPRNGLVPGQNQNVSDLAPDDGNSPVQLPPEPAVPVPFKGTLSGDVARTPIPPLVFVEVEASGNATLLGRYALDIPHFVDPVARLAFGTCEFTAANGDLLSAHFAGQSTLSEVPGVLYIVETAVIAEDGTGRFAGAAGTFVTERWFDMSTGATYGTFEGTLSAPGAGNP